MARDTQQPVEIRHVLMRTANDEDAHDTRLPNSPHHTNNRDTSCPRRVITPNVADTKYLYSTSFCRVYSDSEATINDGIFSH